MHRDIRRMDASPTENSPMRGGRKNRQPLLLTDPLSLSATRLENQNDDDYMSPASVSNHSPTSRYNVAVAAAADNDDCESNFKVVIRVRPPVPRELEGYRPFVDVVRISKDSRLITLCETLDTEDGRGGVYSRQTFTFDHVYDKQSPQMEVYERSAQPAVLSVLQGYNATLMAYGQTGTGKTYTMEGFTSEEQRGIIPRSIEEVFSSIDVHRHENMCFLVRASYMQIYNEVISDLLKPATTRALSVRHTPQRGVHVEGLSEWVVRTPHDVYGLIERGTSLRATSTTRMSELSSRSHAMFTIIVEVMEGDESNPTSYRFGKLNIVDLAGSEKVRQAGVSGQRLEETKKINKSLHELGNVISALANKSGGRNRHVPFRNSVLTSALRDSLGGNCKTTLIACISPALESYTESLSTLVFANRAKNIKNTAVINEDVDQATLLRKYEHELKKLRQQLQGQGEGMQAAVVDAGLVSELRQGMRRAEEDREAALEALHESSRAHLHEQTVRKRFEERIQELELMLKNGGFKGVPRTSDEYALRLDELDRERQVMEEDKAQVDRYKQLLLKQRDIMLNLTTRLNERDETILQLQEEVDAYDAHIQTLEDALETQQQQQQQQRLVNESSNGKSYAPLSKVQAEEYLKRVCVSPCSGEERYRSDVNPSQLLTGEEKMIELLISTPVGSSGTAVTTSTMSAETLLDGEMKHHLTEIVRDRAEMIVWRQLDSHLLQIRREMEHMQDQLLASEQQRQNLEQMMEAAKEQQHPALQETVARTRRHIDEQQEIVRRAYEGRIQALQQQVVQEREQRMRLASEVDTLSVESRRALERCTTAAQRAEINDLCVMVRQLEENIIGGTKQSIGETVTRAAAARVAVSNTNARGASGGHISGNGAAAAGVAVSSPSTSLLSNVAVREMEDKMRVLQSEYAQREEEWHRAMKEKDNAVSKLEELLRGTHVAREEEVINLRKSLNTHKKDRRALQTIMEQRIKTKVDIICELIAEGPQLPPQERQRLSTEARALQNLVNASIQAMES